MLKKIKIISISFSAVFFTTSFIEKSYANESDENCPKGNYYVKAHPRRAYTRADGTFVSVTQVSSSCRPKSKGYEYWHDRLLNVRPPNWPVTNGKEIIKNWTIEEAERFFEAMSDVPEILWTKEIKAIVRFAKSIFPSNAASGTPGYIALYDNAFDKKSNLAQIITHELAHEYYRSSLTDRELEEYLEQAGWATLGDRKNQRDKVVWLVKPERYVEPDGQNSPEEDFSNNVEYFFFNKTKLQHKNKNAYSWIENYFNSKIDKRGK